MPTDFEELGLSRGALSPADRRWLLTIDFEAFTAADLDPWLAAMRAWAREAQARELRFVVFLATENVVQLRAADRDAYARFGAAAAEMAAAGAEWHPHSHYLFDPDTGERPPASLGPRSAPPGYTKRLSLFYDVVHLNGADIGEWLATVREVHEGFLADAGIPLPERPAFRAGGWDYGSTPEELARYVDGLAKAGYAFDSSAVAGEDWRVEARFGANAFALAPGLAEVAPGAGADCGARLLSRRAARALRDVLRQPSLWLPPTRPGVLVTVLHFDHLFGPGAGDPGGLVRRHLRLLARARRTLRLATGGFGDLRLHPSRQAPAGPMT
jgi:hypothetical protein